MTTDMTTAAYRALVTKGMREATFQQQVIALAHANLWRVAHFRGVRIQRRDGSSHFATPVQADGTGYPDLHLVKPQAGRSVVAELKSESGRTTDAQEDWLAWIRAAGHEAYCWRPSQWDEIREVLG